MKLYPEVSASCLFLDRIVNLLDEGVDLAFRIGQLQDSSMQAIAVGQVRRVICGSPEYFAMHGKPTKPEHLSDHKIVSASSVTPSQEWKFIDQGETRSVHLNPRMTTSSNDSAIRAALNGFGITRLMSYQIAQHVQDGQLEMVLQDFEPAPLPVHILHREGRRVPQRVRSFLDLAIDTLRADKRLHSR